MGEMENHLAETHRQPASVSPACVSGAWEALTLGAPGRAAGEKAAALPTRPRTTAEVRMILFVMGRGKAKQKIFD
jgi:hypothetical protein